MGPERDISAEWYRPEIQAETSRKLSLPEQRADSDIHRQRLQSHCTNRQIVPQFVRHDRANPARNKAERHHADENGRMREDGRQDPYNRTYKRWNPKQTQPRESPPPTRRTWTIRRRPKHDRFDQRGAAPRTGLRIIIILSPAVSAGLHDLMLLRNTYQHNLNVWCTEVITQPDS